MPVVLILFIFRWGIWGQTTTPSVRAVVVYWELATVSLCHAQKQAWTPKRQPLPSPCPLCTPCGGGTSEAPNPPPALQLIPEGDGSIINPKLKSLNRAIHGLGKSADSILRLLKGDEIVAESRRESLNTQDLDASSKKSSNSSVRLALGVCIGARVG